MMMCRRFYAYLTVCLRMTRLRSLYALLFCLILILNVIFLASLLSRHSSSSASELVRFVAKPLGFKEKTNPRQRMMELDAVRITGVVSKRYIVTSTPCEHFEGDVPSLDIEETFVWNSVVNGKRDAFVFSAYYDPRMSPPALRIVALAGGYFTLKEKQVKYCQVWYRQRRLPLAIEAQYDIVPETHERSHAGALYNCYLDPHQGVPYAVSLVKEPCEVPGNVLKVTANDPDASPEVNFTVCVSPLNFAYNNTRQLVEMVEVNRLFGAQRFIFYNYSTGAGVLPYIQRYVDEGLAVVIPWHVPLNVEVWPPDPRVEPEIHYFGQLAAINECLYRNMFLSRFIVYSDLDEVIVPMSGDSWIDALGHATLDWEDELRSTGARTMFPGAYLIRNAFFYTDWDDDEKFASNPRVAEELQLKTLLKTDRDAAMSSFYVRSKYILWSRMVSMVSVHSVVEFVNDHKVMNVQVRDEFAKLHHYRTTLSASAKLHRVRDRRMHEFARKIISRTSFRHGLV